MVIAVSVPMGQFIFFRSYLKKMGRRMGGRKEQMNKEQGTRNDERGEIRSEELGVRSWGLGEQREMINDQRSMFNNQRETRNEKRIAIFASGAGSNTQQVINYFNSISTPVATVVLIACNKPVAGVLEIAQKEGIESLLIDRERFFNGDAYLPVLQKAKIDLIVLAGFLWKIPLQFIHAFRNRIINIHPALLPKYGGNGMYGNKVHEAVINSGEKKSGITIHYVNEHYDEGDIIFQATCEVLTDDTAETLAQRIHQLEHQHYPKVIEKMVRNFNAG